MHDDSDSLRINPCNLCPRLCGARRAQGEIGVCGAGIQLRVARAALHFWEEPPLSGEAGSGAVFLVGCPLRCVYCQNHELASAQVGWEIDINRLVDAFMKLQENRALNINLVTPTQYTIQLREAIALARKQGLHVPIVWNTSGYERVEVIQALEGTVDVYLDDFKYADSALAKRYSKAPDYPQVALEALEAMVQTVGPPRYDTYQGQQRMTGGVIVRHLVLPGAIENSKRVLRMLWDRFGESVSYSIMNQYTPVMERTAFARFPELASTVSQSDYEDVLDFADSLGLTDYFWQEGPAVGESFIPIWDGEGIL